MGYYSAIKICHCSNMNGSRYCHTKWNKSDRERKCHMIPHVKYKENNTSKFIFKTEIDSQTENKFMVIKRERVGRRG